MHDLRAANPLGESRQPAASETLGRSSRMSSRPLLDAGESRQSCAALYAPVAEELAAAERIFHDELGSRFPFVQQLVDHSADFQGKRLRPALLLLSGRACGTLHDAHAVLAAVVEMI